MMGLPMRKPLAIGTSEETPRWEIDPERKGVVRLLGRWTVQQSAALESILTTPLPPGESPVVLDASGISGLDTAGAMVMKHLEARLRRAGRPVENAMIPERKAPLLELVATRHARPVHPHRPDAASRL